MRKLRLDEILLKFDKDGCDGLDEFYFFGYINPCVIVQINCIDVFGVHSSNYDNFVFNPYLTNGISHHYHLGESTFIFRGIRSDF